MVSHLFLVKGCSCLWYLKFKELMLLYNWESLGSKMLMKSITCTDFMIAVLRNSFGGVLLISVLAAIIVPFTEYINVHIEKSWLHLYSL